MLIFELFSLTSNRFEPLRQKTLRPILTAAEGYVLGLGAKMFIIAGPVLVYGITAATLYGVWCWIVQMF